MLKTWLEQGRREHGEWQCRCEAGQNNQHFSPAHPSAPRRAFHRGEAAANIRGCSKRGWSKAAGSRATETYSFRYVAGRHATENAAQGRFQHLSVLGDFGFVVSHSRRNL